MAFSSSPISAAGYSAQPSGWAAENSFLGSCSTEAGVFVSPLNADFVGTKATVVGVFDGSISFVARPVTGYIDGDCATQYGDFVTPLTFSFAGLRHAKGGIFQGILNRRSGAFAGAQSTQYGVFSNVTPGFFVGGKATQYGTFAGTRPTLGTFAGTKQTRSGSFDGPDREYPSSVAIIVTSRQFQIFARG